MELKDILFTGFFCMLFVMMAYDAWEYELFFRKKSKKRRRSKG